MPLLMDRACEGDETRRLKAFRRVFTQYDKLDALFPGFIHFALIADALR